MTIAPTCDDVCDAEAACVAVNDEVPLFERDAG